MPGATTVVTTEVGVDAWEEKQTRHNPPPPTHNQVAHYTY